jgi:sugar phosphate isomerase/epimerase
MNHISLCQLTVETGAAAGGSITEGLLRTISAAAAAGFSAVVPRIRPPSGIDAGSGDVSIDVAAVRQRLADTGLTIEGVMSFWLTPDLDPATFAASMDTAAAIGSRGIQVVCHDPVKSRATANFLSVCAMASERKLNVALEFMVYTSVRTLGEARALVAQAEAGNAGICVDALHFYRSGGDVTELANLEPREISLVQLCDAARDAPPADQLRNEARAGRFYPGEGALPLDVFFAALPRGCLLDIEAPCAADAHLSVEDKAKNAARATRDFLVRQQK